MYLYTSLQDEIRVQEAQQEQVHSHPHNKGNQSILVGNSNKRSRYIIQQQKTTEFKNV